MDVLWDWGLKKKKIIHFTSVDLTYKEKKKTFAAAACF